jgi:hypothetical protein
MQFVWTPPTAAGNVVAYEVFATKRDAPIPVLDAMVKGATTYTLTECGAVVINTKLQGWEWRVRGQDAGAVHRLVTMGDVPVQPVSLQ